MASCEDRVADSLYEWFGRRSGCQILSFHPPSGKSYGTDLLRIPKLVAGRRTRGRYHIDIVILEGGYLLLIELKCRLSESGNDIEKLREIRDTYTLGQLVQIIRRRMTRSVDLTKVKGLVLGVGVEETDLSQVPEDFVVFSTGSGSPTVAIGRLVPAEFASSYVPRQA